MVPFDAERLVESLSGLPLIKRGAESEIRLGRFLGLPAVFKVRVRKPYMHPRLAARLVAQRTRREAKVIAAALRAGVSAPLLLAVLPSAGVLVMEYVEGPLLKEVLAGAPREEALKLAREAGAILGRLHSAGIVHGDPTTSNYIVSRRGLVLIDYGLAEFSEHVEERAVDLHLFRRAVEATHASLARDLYEAMLEGYRSVMGAEAERVAERAEEIRLRGRYVEERRRSVWQAVG